MVIEPLGRRDFASSSSFGFFECFSFVEVKVRPLDRASLISPIPILSASNMSDSFFCKIRGKQSIIKFF